jgi:DNA-binding NarL/FixJ family response regulator
VVATLRARGFDVVGIADRAHDAVSMADELHPEIVLVDLGLPDRSGVSVGREILDSHPGTIVLALTALEEPRMVDTVLEAGFRGYIIKDVGVDAFISSIRAAIDGQTVMPSYTAGARVGRATGSGLLAEQLTRRELQVLSLLVEGVTGATIAERLGISANTVRTHVQSILTKLQVHSRLEAATFAVRTGLFEGRPYRDAATHLTDRRRDLVRGAMRDDGVVGARA